VPDRKGPKWYVPKTGDSDYLRGAKKQGWYRAFYYCKRYGGELAYVADAAHMGYMNEGLKRHGIKHDLWIAGKRKSRGRGPFIWKGHEKDVPFKYTNWGKKQPKGRGRCIVLRFGKKSYKWALDKCRAKAIPLCMRKKP